MGSGGWGSGSKGSRRKGAYGEEGPQVTSALSEVCVLLEWELTLGCVFPTETRFLTEMTEGKDLFWLTV